MPEPEDSPQKPSPPKTSDHRYEVGAPQAAPPQQPGAPETSRALPRKRTAIFVAHGMGQQIPFQTLDDVAAGLLEQDGRWSKPKARFLEVEIPGGNERERLQRIELIHRDDQGDERHAHIYEAYWAPLTEGRVSLRDVMGFLFGAGWNGLQKGTRTFQRWLFGEPRTFEVPVRVVLYLVVALLVVASLVVMNSIILTVAAARGFFQEAPPAWLTSGLFADLSTTLNFFLTIVFFFTLSLGLAVAERKIRGKREGGFLLKLLQALSLIGFVAMLFATVLAAVAMIVLLYQHAQLPTDPQTEAPEIWKQLLGGASVEDFNRIFERSLGGLLAVAAAGLLLYWVGKTAWIGLRDLMTKKGLDRLLTLFAGSLTLLLVFAAAGLVYFLSSESLSTLLVLKEGAALRVLRRGISWPVLIGASLFVRSLIVQYVGDVAVYVASHRLDRFHQLRQEIRDLVFRTARAVYAARENGSAAYDEIVIVGHSLGSAIVYDVLNRLVNEDLLASRRDATPLGVVSRTPLLLTFGSPLDKFAFLFALQSDSAGRQAVAATLQPLLQDNYAYRPKRWINIHSPWDIISGDLDFYDPPGSVHHPEGTTLMRNSKHVEDLVDTRASTWLVAHVEYWRNPRLLEVLHKQVTT